jgi:hypothetical protein
MCTKSTNKKNWGRHCRPTQKPTSFNKVYLYLDINPGDI